MGSARQAPTQAVLLKTSWEHPLHQTWENGRLSSGQVEIIIARLNDKRTALLAGHETELVAQLERLGVDDLRVVMGEWTARADAIIDPRPPAEHDSEASFTRTLDDRGELRASLAADDAVTVETALDLATSPDAEGEARTPKQRRADALIDIMRHYLDNHDHSSGSRHRPHVNVIVTLEQLQGELPGGTSIDGWNIDTPDLATWICDSTLRRVLQAKDHTLDFGTAVRSVPASLYNAVAVRDRHCRWPGCDRRARHCDAHHVRFWSHGGPTSIDNLALLCRRHHRKLHHPGYHAKLDPDGALTITLPDNRTITSHPPRAGPTLF